MSLIKHMKQYRQNPTPRTAKRLLDWINAYPICECLMTEEDWKTKQEAWELLTGE